MNSNTREALKDFIRCVEALAQGTIHMIGTETCTEIMIQADKLKEVLDSDETIL